MENETITLGLFLFVVLGFAYILHKIPNRDMMPRALSHCPNCNHRQNMRFWQKLESKTKCKKCKIKYVIKGYIAIGRSAECVGKIPICPKPTPPIFS